MFRFLFSSNYLPHQFCYLAQPWLVWTNVTTDGLIAISYLALFLGLFWLAYKLRDLEEMKGYLWIFFAFGTFILTCGLTHVMEIVTVWWPVYRLCGGDEGGVARSRRWGRRSSSCGWCRCWRGRWSASS